MKKTRIHVQFGFVSSIMFFKPNNLSTLLFIIIIIIIYLSLIYVKPHRDAVLVTFTSNKFMFW